MAFRLPKLPETSEYMHFETMISTPIIRWIHLLGEMAISIGSIGWWFIDSDKMIPAFLILVFGNLVWRLICEAWILFFRIHETLVAIEHNTGAMVGRPEIVAEDTFL